MQKTICLCMIVKNESSIIAKTLNAIKSILDYWIIVDTGSEDDTKEIIQETLDGVPGELLERKWVNFGYNRTESLRLAKGKADYILLCDADEEMVIEDDFDKSTLEADAYDIKYQGVMQYWVPYLLKDDGFDWKYVGPAHEYLSCEQPFQRTPLPSISIIHHCCGAYRAEKFERGIKLLRESLVEDPNNMRSMFYLANNLRDTGQYDEAIEWYQKRIVAGGWEEEVTNSLYNIGVCHNHCKRKDAAKLAFLKSYNHDFRRAEPLWQLAKMCRSNKEYAEGCLYAEAAMRIIKPELALFVYEPVYTYLSLFEFSICAYYVDRRAEAKEANDRLLAMSNIDEQTRSSVEKNAKYYS